MMHFSCDLCGKNLMAGDNRYTLKMEVCAAHDPAELTQDDLDSDHLEEIGQILSDEDFDPEPAPSFKKMKFDLCPNCHKKFIGDPLGRELQKFDFSAN